MSIDNTDVFTSINAAPVFCGPKALQSNKVVDFVCVGGDFVTVTSDVNDGDGVRLADIEDDNDEVRCRETVRVCRTVGVGEALR